jgi:hypothetical protein
MVDLLVDLGFGRWKSLGHADTRRRSSVGELAPIGRIAFDPQ